MDLFRQLIIIVLILGIAAPSAYAQSPFLTRSGLMAAASSMRLEPTPFAPQQSRPVLAAMHPAAKGALVGGAVGAGFIGGVGLWYCTIGPHEAGECSNGADWARNFALWGAIGAGIGALIGAMTR